MVRDVIVDRSAPRSLDVTVAPAARLAFQPRGAQKPANTPDLIESSAAWQSRTATARVSVGGLRLWRLSAADAGDLRIPAGEVLLEWTVGQRVTKETLVLAPGERRVVQPPAGE